MARTQRKLVEPFRGFVTVCVALAVLWIPIDWPVLHTARSHFSWETDDLLVLDFVQTSPGKWRVDPVHQWRVADSGIREKLVEERVNPDADYRAAVLDMRTREGTIRVRKMGVLRLSEVHWFAPDQRNSGPMNRIDTRDVDPGAARALVSILDDVYSGWERMGDSGSAQDFSGFEWRYESQEFLWERLVALFGPSGGMVFLACGAVFASSVLSERRKTN